MQAWSRILILLAATVQGLKLTPVHHGMQKIDLSYESHVATTALTNALQKIEDGNLPFHDSKALLETEEIQKLHSVVRRWANMEDRLKGAIAPGSTSQVRCFRPQIVPYLALIFPSPFSCSCLRISCTTLPLFESSLVICSCELMTINKRSLNWNCLVQLYGNTSLPGAVSTPT